ncbi:alpha/beta hydrolase family protein [Actinoplanes sp. RD1]|uniref:alpha/beta hydrolase family protein n=1 Tax=Actinoplanes sp. RD1 TaxID=3064538 RepID=UPI002740B55D|nr:alpha/beta hydrolase [Actinoplanes sp. RD1]
MTIIVSTKPIKVPPLRVRVTAPRERDETPVILFSHGFGSSYDAYGPLVDHWATAGFAVIQPTHLDSRRLNVPVTADSWRRRVDDLKAILDRLEILVPGHTTVAVAGHSFGGQTAGNLLGLRVHGEDHRDERVTAGVLLATAGRGGDDLADTPFRDWLSPDFSHMSTPALVVVGDRDDSPLTTRGPDWTADPYHLSPGPKALLTLAGAEHSLGGIPGYEARETTDENPAHVATIQRVTTAFLKGESLAGVAGVQLRA